MHNITLRVGVLATLLLLSRNSMGAPASQQEVNPN